MKERHPFLWLDGAKAEIIKILGQGKMSLQSIHTKLKKHKVEQGTVYGYLLQLEQKGIVKRDGNHYQLHETWLAAMLSFFEQAQQKSSVQYKDATPLPGRIVHFACLSSLDLFMQQFEQEIIKNLPANKTSSIAWAVRHSWVNIMYLQQQDGLLRQFKKKGIQLYSLVGADTPLDRINAKIYQKLGMRAKTGVALFPTDLGVYNGEVVAVIMPLELQQELDKFFASTKTFEELDVHYLLHTLFERQFEIPIQLIFYEDKKLAKTIRNKILVQFKK